MKNTTRTRVETEPLENILYGGCEYPRERLEENGWEFIGNKELISY